MSEGAVLLLVYVLPSAAALLLSFAVRSAISRHLLRWPAALSLGVAGLTALAIFDCDRLEFTFGACRSLPDAFGDAMGPLQILYVLGYLAIGPLLLVAAAVAEALARRRR